MDDDLDIKDSLDLEEENVTQIARWLPRLVVAGTIAGFVALAWYAYRTGTQSIHDDDLLVIEADRTPVKEKPADPGGMKFPNQDKTIFETFANNPQMPPKVERLLPAPEEPNTKQLDTSGTKTWINEKLHQKEEDVVAPERIINTQTPPPVDAARHETSNTIVSYTNKAAEDKEPEKPVVSAPPVTTGNVSIVPDAVKEELPAEEEPKKAPPVKAAGKSKVQLGAYRSEKEAKEAFAKIQKKFSALADASPIVVKADLGKKGIYYRLRVGGFADDAAAKEFCKGLSAKGQACIVAY